MLSMSMILWSVRADYGREQQRLGALSKIGLVSVSCRGNQSIINHTHACNNGRRLDR